MLTFMILVLPLFLGAYCFKVRTKKVVPVILIGVFSAVIVVAFKMLFLLSHRIIPYNFSENIIYFLIKESLLPVIILYGLYFLISKDNYEYKLNTYLPLILSFYSVYLPYCIISSTSSAYSWYSIFLKPVIYALMIGQTGLSVRDLYRSIVSGRKIKVLINAVLILFYFIVPAVIESIYVMNYFLLLLFGIALVYLALPVLLYILNNKQK